jgi:hypothetical protein
VQQKNSMEERRASQTLQQQQQQQTLQQQQQSALRLVAAAVGCRSRDEGSERRGGTGSICLGERKLNLLASSCALAVS